MNLLAPIFDAYAAWRWRQFEAACREPAATQQRVLIGLLRRAAHTQFGLRFDFASIRSGEQFAARVPVTTYAEQSPHWLRACDGERDVCWPGHVRYFAISSGTTAGEKLLPVSAEAIRSNLRAGGLLASMLARRGGAKALLGGKFLYLGGSTTLREKGRCLYGDASGIVTRHIPGLARRRHLPQPDIAAIGNWEQKIDRIVERYSSANIAAISACPSWAALLFRQMLAAAGGGDAAPHTIGELWPNLAFFVSYGMAFGPYRTAFDQYVGRALHYVDTYSSSEGGMTAIQAEPGGPLRLIIDNGVYFEFVPADRAGEPDAPRLHVGQVELGVDYAVTLSTNGGIWAYPLGDVVRFVSLRPPAIVFAGRTQIQLSAFGEHVSMDMMENAVAAACDKTGAIVADYTVAPRFPSPPQPVPAHRWVIEFDRPPADPSAFMAELDGRLRSYSEDYDVHRTDNYGLQPPVLIAAARGTFFEWMKRKGKLGGQHKVPRVARTAEMFDELVEIHSEKSRCTGRTE